MAKLFALLFALCVVPSIVTAVPLLLKGTVLCDLCKVGFETNAVKPIQGAVVHLVCTERNDTSKITHTQKAVTNSLGQYLMEIVEDHVDNICNVKLGESGDDKCNVTSVGREQGRVILTCNNGLATNNRYANTLLYESNTPLASCTKILQKYQEVEDED